MTDSSNPEILPTQVLDSFTLRFFTLSMLDTQANLYKKWQEDVTTLQAERNLLPLCNSQKISAINHEIDRKTAEMNSQTTFCLKVLGAIPISEY